MARTFIGRDNDLDYLEGLFKKKAASFVVIRGRRRIGKSRLIEEFSKSSKSYILTGVPPTPATTRQSQLDEFSGQIARIFGVPKISMDNWGDLFWHLGRLCQQGRMVIALDEISWIGSKDPDFLGQLKTAWDLYFSHNPELILIVCGSVSSWITKNILSSTGFVGRISVDLCLEELSLHEAVQFWGERVERISSHEILKVLSVTGGVPRYLEEIKPEWSAEQNIQWLCFDKRGLLFGEFDRIFSDLFSTRAETYADLARALVGGSRTQEQLAAAVGKATSTVSPYLYDLVHAGFIREDPTWNSKEMKLSTLKQYRLSDNYLRFYLRYIAPNRKSIEGGAPWVQSLVDLPEWESIAGLQFENLVLNNVRELAGAMRLEPADLLAYGPYFQRANKRQKGCQVDLLIQARYRAVYLGEVKFSSNPIGMEVVHQMREKLQRIDFPNGWSVRPVLIHVNGVTPEVRQSQVFDHIVDFSELLN